MSRAKNNFQENGGFYHSYSISFRVFRVNNLMKYSYFT